MSAIALFPFALSALFTGLKAIGAIDWTWSQALIPAWIALIGVLPIALLIKLVLKLVVKSGGRIP